MHYNIKLLGRLIAVAFLTFAGVACSDDDDDDINWDEERIYEVKVIGTWRLEDYEAKSPDFFRNSDGFTNIIGLAHNNTNVIYSYGRQASSEFAKYCDYETQDYAGLKTYLETTYKAEDEGSVIIAPEDNELEREYDEVTFRFKTTLRKSRFVTVVGRIKNSPDWFISAQNIDLKDAGSYAEYIFEIGDAGVRKGNKLVEEDELTAEKEDLPVSRITTDAANDMVIEGAVPVIGYVSIQRIFE